MADTFRALCSELLHGLDENRHPEVRYPGHLRQIMASARAALTDEQAVPEGREPAAVITEPSDEEGPSIEDVEELCEEHCFNVIGYESIERLQGLINEAIARWGNLKASLTSSPPADGEVAELTGQLIEAANGAAAMGWDQHAKSILRAAELLQRPMADLSPTAYALLTLAAELES